MLTVLVNRREVKHWKGFWLKLLKKYCWNLEFLYRWRKNLSKLETQVKTSTVE